MKKLLLIVTTMISLMAKSQTSVYHPFPTTNANWIYQSYDDYGNPRMWFSNYSITGDTIILGTNYKNISGCFSNGLCESGAIRENNKVIYYRSDTATSEYVLYDFNLNLGDTLLHPYGGAVCVHDTAIVDFVDSVMTSDGYHRRLHFNSFASWIEGVGSINYLLAPCQIACVSGNDFLVCMAADSGFHYPAAVSWCFTSVPEQSQLNNMITISPNPMLDKLNIEINSNELSEIILFDISSRKILQQKFINSVSINTEQLPEGLYFYELTNKEGLGKRGRVIKD